MYHLRCTLRFIFFLTIFCAPITEASNSSEDSCWSSDGFPKPRTPQYQSWHRKYRSELEGISTTTCNVTLDNYRQAFYAEASSPESSQLLCRCIKHERCILEHLNTDVMANFQSAAVVLGLMPTLLSSLGPSIAEISLLSAHRPVLSFLLSMGAPAVWPTRIFEYNDPASILMPMDANNNPKLVIGALANKSLSLAISATQYLLAVGAVANVITTSIELGERSILAWGCTTTFLPLLWTSLAAVIHVIAAASYTVARRKACNKPTDEGKQLARRRRAPGQASHSQSKRQMVLHFISKIYRTLAKETTICANQDKRDEGSTAQVPTATILLNIVASGCSFVHVVFGTIVFSSFQFVSVWDVLNQIIWRYALSTVICKMLLIVELAGLRNGSKGLRELHDSDDLTATANATG